MWGRKPWSCIFGAVLAVGAAACGGGGGTPVTPDARPNADAGFDASVVDAGDSDAPPVEALEGTPGRELVTGGARVSGGTVTMDVQVGHGMSQQPTIGGTRTLQGTAAVKPQP